MGYSNWVFTAFVLRLFATTKLLYHRYDTTRAIAAVKIALKLWAKKWAEMKAENVLVHTDTHTHIAHTQREEGEKRVKSLEYAKMKRKLRYRRYYIKIPYEFASFIL